MNIHPCPFCGEKEQFELEDTRRRDLAYRKDNMIKHYAELQKAIRCYGCGALGPVSLVQIPRGDALSQIYEREADNYATLAWNARSETSAKAFELVNEIIEKSLSAVAASTPES